MATRSPVPIPRLDRSAATAPARRSTVRQSRRRPPFPSGGYAGLVELLASGLTIQTGVPVRQVEYDRRGVRVLTDSTEATAVGTAPAYLAYPRGQYGPEHKRMAREAGYRGACAVVLGFSDLRRADRFELRRMTVKGTESMLRFRARLGLGARIRLREWSPA